MERWVGKVAVVTGASSGIGAAVAIDLVKSGMITIGLARRIDRIVELQSQIPSTAKGKLVPKKCDVSSEEDIIDTFKWIEANFGGVDVLINNAGVYPKTTILAEDNSKAIKDTLAVNLGAAVFCIREAFKSMRNRSEPGHIVLMNSIAGHSVADGRNLTFGLNLYPSSKHGITVLTEVVRQELQMHNTRIKITSMSPGFVKTEIFEDDVYENNKYLQPEDVSNAILFVLGTPEHVQVHEMIIKPVGELV